ncbi:MAG: hypothetical protein WBX18_13610 [Terracidiphilus sp.]
MTTAAVADFEIEEHVAEHNRLFKQTKYTLDDLDVYAEPFGSVLRAVYGMAEGHVTERQVIHAVRLAANQLKAAHAVLDFENAA